jgi:hypothetical protein
MHGWRRDCCCWRREKPFIISRYLLNGVSVRHDMSFRQEMEETGEEADDPATEKTDGGRMSDD